MPRALTERERARLAALERLLQGVIQRESPHLPALDGLDARDAEAIAAADPRRLLVYRKLVRGTLRDSIEKQIPRTAARLGASAFEHYVARFCSEELPRSQVLRDVAFEFSAWAAPRWAEDTRLPPHLADLARYELFEFDVYASPRRPAPEEQALAADRGVAFDDTLRLARFAHAVQRLGDDATEEPAREPTALLGYRDKEGELMRMELTPAASSLLALLAVEGEPLGRAVQRACEQHGTPLDQRVIDATAQLLADLAERGVVFGPRPPGPPAPPSPFFSWLLGPDPFG